jgi:hypothetical protein
MTAKLQQQGDSSPIAIGDLGRIDDEMGPPPRSSATMTCRQIDPVVIEFNCPSIERVSVPSEERVVRREAAGWMSVAGLMTYVQRHGKEPMAPVLYPGCARLSRP